MVLQMGLYKISESIRAYAYLIPSSQASAKSGMVGNAAECSNSTISFFE